MRTLYCICVAKFWQQWGYRGAFQKLPPCLRGPMAPGSNIVPLAKAETSSSAGLMLGAPLGQCVWEGVNLLFRNTCSLREE